jgi:hypothetical protein
MILFFSGCLTGLILGASLLSLRRQPRPVITLTPVIPIDIDVPAVRRRK